MLTREPNIPTDNSGERRSGILPQSSRMEAIEIAKKNVETSAIRRHKTMKALSDMETFIKEEQKAESEVKYFCIKEFVGFLPTDLNIKSGDTVIVTQTGTGRYWRGKLHSDDEECTFPADCVVPWDSEAHKQYLNKNANQEMKKPTKPPIPMKPKSSLLNSVLKR